MTPWYLSEWLAFDTETTGVDVETDRIVTAALVWCRRGEPIETRTWLSNAGGMEIPVEATAVHGITTKQARELGRPAELVLRHLARLLAWAIQCDMPIVVMKAPYDLTLLDRELDRYGMPPLAVQAGAAPMALDPLVLDKGLDQYRSGRRNLTAMCQHYDVPLLAAHRADADATAAAQVTYRIVSQYPELRAMDLPTLQERQAVWAREQAAGLQRYLRKSDPAAVVDGSWPLIPRQVAQ